MSSTYLNKKKGTMKCSHSFLFSFLFLACLYSSLADKIGDVCPKTTNPQLCDKVLRSVPGSGQANFVGLCEIAINKAIDPTNSAKNLVNSLIGQTKDPILLPKYNICLQSFSDAVGKLNGCKNFLKDKNFKNLKEFATIAYVSGVDCDHQFEDPSSQNPQLKEASNNAQDYNSFVYAIATILYGGM
ncbi:hypothetical protein LIER_43256 [Lithospermum erythrorhizon]|uniref:Pectinesterase inhibitor domain-containing protein n=1 Tax=Lithospermum erythrorhizon TaxID=34254 RepID=A0AAV3PUL5_LITER